MFTVLLAYVVFFFACFHWLGTCVEVDVDRITILPHPPTPLLIFFPTHNSFFNACDRYLKFTRA